MEKLEKCKEIIKNEISSEYLNEANEIIELTDDDYHQQLIELYKLNNGNALCLLLDKIKYELVSNNKMVQNKTDGFGHTEYFM